MSAPLACAPRADSHVRAPRTVSLVRAARAASLPRVPARAGVALALPALVTLTAALLLAPGLGHADGMRDPMRPPLPAQRTAATHEAIPVLSGIVSVDGRRRAIVDGHLVHAGSVLGSVTIDAILEDGVRYRNAHGVRELHLAPASSIKKPSVQGRGESS